MLKGKGGTEKRRRPAPPNIAQPPFSLFPETAVTGEEKSFSDGLKAVVNLLKGRKNVLVLVGAGMSVSVGIPDFRSKGSGLYETLDVHEYGLCTPEEVFHLEVFEHDPRPFYKFAAQTLYANNAYEPSISHRFISLLEEKKMLLRVYTQNIDGLEERAGVSPRKVVYAHGSLSTLSCQICGAKVSADQVRSEILAGNVPRCTRSRPKRKRPSTTGTRRAKKSNESESDPVMGPPCNGVLKPGITFFGEKLVDKVTRSLEQDRSKADAVIVIGTSLSVAPMSKVIEYLSPSIPRILINRNIVIPKQSNTENKEDESEEEQDHRHGYIFDACLLGFCDEVTRSLVRVIEGEQIYTSNEKVFCHSTNTADSFNLMNHPAERVLLFAGANLDEEDQHSEAEYDEIVHCDACENVIDGPGRGMRCTVCFDYDLCIRCYPRMKRKHFCDNHKFERF